MKYSDIEKFTKNGNYRVNIAWSQLEHALHRYLNEHISPLNLNPEYQRGHVWTEEQKIAYVEFKLKDGQGSDIIYLNCPGWMIDFRGPFELVDGKQRIQAVLDFLNNKIKVFGCYYSEFKGRIPSHADFVFIVNDLTKKSDVLNWYIQINTGGTPHTDEEINKVKSMLVKILNEL